MFLGETNKGIVQSSVKIIYRLSKENKPKIYCARSSVG